MDTISVDSEDNALEVNLIFKNSIEVSKMFEHINTKMKLLEPSLKNRCLILFQRKLNNEMKLINVSKNEKLKKIIK